MLKKLQGVFYILLTTLLISTNISKAFGQCTNPTVPLPDAQFPIDGNLDNGYCVTLSFDPAIVGFPTGIQMDLIHDFQGDLSISVSANNQLLNVMQRPGDANNCDGGGPFGFSSDIDGTFSFSDGGPEPEFGLTSPSGDGAYGVTAEDGCGIGSPGISSFADLWATYSPGETVTADICITDHAFMNFGSAGNITFLFPNPQTCGCIDPFAINFDPTASIDGGGCLYACPDLGLTVAQDYYEFCSDSLSFTLLSNASLAVEPTYLWTANNGGISFIDSSMNANTLINIPDSFIGTIIFTVTATDRFGCSESENIEVQINPLPGVEIIGFNQICADSLSELSLVGGPYNQISWPSLNENTSTVLVDTGFYTVIVENIFTCQNTDSFRVDSFATIEPNIVGDLELCHINAQSLLESSAIYQSYLWSTNEVTSSISVTQSGTYGLTVQDSNDCFSEASITLTDALPVPVNIQGDSSICVGDSTLISAPLGFVHYEWNTGDTIPNIFVNTASNFSVTVEDNNGCLGLDSLTTNLNALPIPTISGPIDLCVNIPSQLFITDSFPSIEWSNGIMTSTTIQIPGPGQYHIAVTDTLGCTGLDTISVSTTMPTPVNIQGVSEICANTEQQLMASGNFSSYLWSSNENSSTITINSPGLYTVTATEANGCVSSISTNITLSPALSPSISGTLAFCPNDSTTISTQAEFDNYIWSNSGSNTEQLSVSTTGNYSLTVTNNDGCQGEANVMITEFTAPTPQILGDVEFCAGQSTQLSTDSYASYSWDIEGGMNTQFVDVSTPQTVGLTVTDTNTCIGETSVILTENPLPVHSIQATSGFCPNESTILTAENGFPIYAWSNNSNATSIEVNTAQTYTLSITDGNGCIGVDSVQITEYLTSIPQLQGNTQFCPSDSTTLSISNLFQTYLWSTGDSVNTITTDQTGQISVTVTDTNGCETENTVALSLFQITPPVIDAPSGFCSGSTATLTASVGYSSYNWSNSIQTETNIVSDGGAYNLDVIDPNGCSSNAMIIIDEYSLPTPSIAGSLVFCENLSTIIQSDTTFSQYMWSTGESTPQININTIGLVGLTVTDDNNCVGQTSALIEEVSGLSPEITGGMSFCEGGTTILNETGSFANYLWSNGSLNPSITVDTEGDYSVTVTDESGCEGIDSVQITENLLPVPSIDGTLNFCQGSNALLASSNIYNSYLWSTNDTTASINVNTTGNYSLTVTDSNNCSNSTIHTIEELPLPIFSINGEQGFCENSSTTLTIQPSFTSYEWSSGSDQQSVIINQSGNISTTVTDSAGCQSSQSMEINSLQLPIADAGETQTLDCETTSVELGGTTNPTGNYSYQWQGPGIEPNSTNSLHPLVNEAGLYDLIITNEDTNCESLPVQVLVNDVSYVPQVNINTPDTLDCLTESVFLDGLNSDIGQEFIYQWFDSNLNPIENATSLVYQANIPQVYTFQVLDTFTHCFNQANIEVVINNNTPFAEAGMAQEINCNQSTVILDGSTSDQGNNIEYSWSNSDEGIIGDPLTNMVEVNSSGTYYLSVENNLNGCISVDSVTVQENIIYPTIMTSGDIELSCLDQTTELNGLGSSTGIQYNYQWLYNQAVVENESQIQIEISQSGLYTLQIINTENGCLSESTINVSSNPNSPQDITYTSIQPTCAGDNDGSIAISQTNGGTSPYLYSINGSVLSNSSTFSQLTAGNYSILVEDAAGCLLESSINIPDGNSLQLDLGEDLYLSEDELATIQPLITIDSSQLSIVSWEGPVALDCPECLNQIDLVINESTQFILNVTDENGCTASDRIAIFVDKNRSIYAPNVFSPNGDGRNDVFYIFTKEKQVKINSLMLFDRWGEPVFEQHEGITNSPEFGWNGKYQNQTVNPAVFVWFAELEFKDGNKEFLTGNVLIIE